MFFSSQFITKNVSSQQIKRLRPLTDDGAGLARLALLAVRELHQVALHVRDGGAQLGVEVVAGGGVDAVDDASPVHLVV